MNASLPLINLSVSENAIVSVSENAIVYYRHQSYVLTGNIETNKFFSQFCLLGFTAAAVSFRFVDVAPLHLYIMLFSPEHQRQITPQKPSWGFCFSFSGRVPEKLGNRACFNNHRDCVTVPSLYHPTRNVSPFFINLAPVISQAATLLIELLGVPTSQHNYIAWNKCMTLYTVTPAAALCFPFTNNAVGL